MMRLLLIIPSIVSYDFLRELCRSLIAEGTEVHLACAPGDIWGKAHAPEHDGVQRHDIEFARGMNPLRHLQAARALRRLVTEVDPHVIHVHFSAAIFTTALARRASWPRTIGMFHGVCFPAMQGWKAALLRVMETWSAQRLDTAWVLTDDDRAHLQAAAPRAQVRTLPGFGLGCDLARFTPPDSATRQRLRAALGLRPEEIAFVFLGRFVDFKGFGEAARAFLALASAHPEARLLLIGARDGLHPTGLSPAEETTLWNCAQVRDFGFRDDVPECLGAADVMIFPSRREGMPVCLMEALAMGVPAITCDSRGCREVVRDGVDGRVLPQQDGAALVAAMRAVLTDPSILQRWSTAALAERDRFDRRQYIDAQTKIYLDTAEKSARQPAPAA